MNISPDSFFNDLLAETGRQFLQSPVYRKQTAKKKKWNYAICATPIKKNRGVIFGINWGGDNHSAQTSMPTGDGISNYHFIKQSRQFLEKHWGLDLTKNNFNYTNLCFFRSPKENILENKDYELSLPLFKKFVEYINPPWLLSIGVINLKILDRNNSLKNIQRHFDNEKKFKGHSATLWDNFRIFSVPHPSSRLTSTARRTIWTKVTNEMKKCNNPLIPTEHR